MLGNWRRKLNLKVWIGLYYEWVEVFVCESGLKFYDDVNILPVVNVYEDKYELFKEWLRESDYYFQKENVVAYFSMDIVFENFEYDLKKKEEEAKIQEIIKETIKDVVRYCGEELWCDKLAIELVDKLKEEGVL